MDNTNPVSIDTLCKIYMKMRSKISELNSEIAKIEDQKEQVSIAMRDQLKSLGVQSVRTEHGTVTMTKKTAYYTQDWDSFKQFVLENQAVDLLERRIAQRNMTQFLEENPGLVPPGLNAESKFDVSVRKPTTK
jgi:hypothetical protein